MKSNKEGVRWESIEGQNGCGEIIRRREGETEPVVACCLLLLRELCCVQQVPVIG